MEQDDDAMDKAIMRWASFSTIWMSASEKDYRIMYKYYYTKDEL
jgi:hypothetical protein